MVAERARAHYTIPSDELTSKHVEMHWVNTSAMCELKMEVFNTPSHVFPHGLQVMDLRTRLE